MRALKSIKAAAVDRICRLDRFSPAANKRFCAIATSEQVGTQFAAGGQLFERSEENAGGVPKEEFPVADVTREHGVGGVSGLLPDLERGDTRPSRAGREACTQAMTRMLGTVEPAPIRSRRINDTASPESRLTETFPCRSTGRNTGPFSICLALCL
jgi:hypothetical protein